MQLHTYLNYGGNCEEAFRFYEQHLGGRSRCRCATANSGQQLQSRPFQRRDLQHDVDLPGI